MTILRIISTLTFAYVIRMVYQNADSSAGPEDLTAAFYLGVTVIAAIFTGLTWAPVIGEAISDPFSTTHTFKVPDCDRFLTIRLIRRWDHQGRKRLTRWLCFWEGLNRPWLPAPFTIGLKNSPRGSWIEKAFAREVYRFNNAENCQLAWVALQRHGIEPQSHSRAEVNRLISSLKQETAPPPDPLSVPKATEEIGPKRNRRIQLPSTEQADKDGSDSVINN